MPFRKEYIVVNGTSASFTVNLAKPLEDVVKTDLVSTRINAPSFSDSIVLIGSMNLGNSIRTTDYKNVYWRMTTNPSPSSTSFVSYLSRVDTYFESPRTIRDIDISLYNPNGTLLTGVTSVSLVIEFERDVKENIMIFS